SSYSVATSAPPPKFPPFPYTTLFRSPMKRTALNAAIAAILVAGLALAGCNRDANDTADRDTTPATDTTGATGDMPPATTDTSAIDRKSTRLNSSHVKISYAVFCLKKK